MRVCWVASCAGFMIAPMKTQIKICAALVLAVCVVGAGAAQKRAVDSSGCWTGPRGGLHCTKVARGSDRLPGGETHTQRDKRLARECKGMPNAGACLGYGKR